MNETRDFDILSPAFHANPFPELDRMRAAGPVVPMRLPAVERIQMVSSPRWPTPKRRAAS
jgi:hypothetical protein